jgi:hypothetical protein
MTAALTDRLSTADYRRRSRQVRARYFGQPRRMYQELSALSGRSIAPSDIARPSKTGDFARLVASTMDGPALRYSARLALLRQAEQTGIDRFEANLMIAAIVHRAGKNPNQVQTMDQPMEIPPARDVAPPWKLMILTAVVTQAVIVAGAWLVFWR